MKGQIRMAESAKDVSAADVERLTTEVLRLWRQRLRRLADDRPRTGERGESERLLVSALLRVSDTETEDSLAALAAAAANYGAAERRSRLDPGALCDELAYLRDIVWRQLKAMEASTHQAVGRILRFDRALSVAMKAAVSAGYPRALRESAQCELPSASASGEASSRKQQRD
jgi:hypothetical protein